MSKEKISSGTAHQLPPDMRTALLAHPKALVVWQSLTPLARNEWICWVTFVKKEETRKEHIKRTTEELLEGKRRPCCWVGCIHRADKPMSASVKWALRRKAKKKKPAVG